jgi:hypothetical protein
MPGSVRSDPSTGSEDFMAVTTFTEAGGKRLIVSATDKLSYQDYEQFVPETERLIRENGKIRVLFEMHKFHGWEPGALWEDVKFDLKHFRDIERLAIVGDQKWERSMSTFCRPFTTATVRYFDAAQVAEARAWLAAP